MIKKIKVFAKSVGKKTRTFMKKAGKKANTEGGKIIKAVKKEWKKEQPQREEYKKKIIETANKAEARAMKLFKEGIKNSIKIGSDVADTIKKDIKEIRDNK